MKTNIRKNKTGIIGIVVVVACVIVLVSAPAFAEIVLEIHSNTANNSVEFTDSADLARTINVNGNVSHSTDQAKFGASSIYFDGTGAYLSIQDSADWNFGGGNFTIDFWARNNVAPTFKYVFNFYTDIDNRWGFRDDGAVYHRLSGSGQYLINEAPAEDDKLTQDTWEHVAIVYNGSTLSYFKNGALKDSVSTSVNFSFANSVIIGQLGNGSNFLNGYLDDFYIRKNEALDEYEISSIADIGNELREDLTSGLNDGGANQFSLGYTTEEISQLAQLYADGAGSVTIGDLTWSYVGGTLPGDTGYAIGEAYTYKGKWYVKLGSGFEGVPELPAGVAPLVMMVFGIGMRFRNRRKV